MQAKQMEADIQNVIEEIEIEKSLEKVSAVRIFRSLLNQPDFVAVNSTDRVDSSSSLGYSEFSIDLPRPILEAESIQLVSATVPTCTQNIPDTALVFWYYKLSAYSGDLPSINNLHFVRLLPSYYKKELIAVPDTYGYNQTFHEYQDLSNQLEKACKSDLANDILSDSSRLEKLLISSRFLPYDISIFYDEKINKFRMTGNNAYIAPAYQVWDPTISYLVNQKVFFTRLGKTLSFTCIQNNSGINPFLSPLFWVADNGDIILEWNQLSVYGIGYTVSFFGDLYESVEGSTNESPATNPDFWELIPEDYVWNRYLIAGYNDPNVIKSQGSCLRPWESDYFFENNVIVEYKNTYFQSTRQTINQLPDDISGTDWIQISVPISKCESVGNTITVYCDSTIFQTVTPDTKMFISKSSNQFFNVYPTDGFIESANFYKLVSVSAGQVVLLNEVNFFEVTNSFTSLGGILSLSMPPDYGLTTLSGQFDFASDSIGGIPAQPYNPKPKRLLNSILGFTWNGVYNNTDFGPNYTVNSIQGLRFNNLTLLNKLRPLPDYRIAIDTELGVTEDEYDKSSTYTADGYCNLVFSSTVQLYGSVVQGSTLNSTTSTGLLGSVMLNAKNLGVAFFQEGFSAPLSIFGSDIYSLSFQFKDDMNEPYTLTNNATVIFVLKITYK